MTITSVTQKPSGLYVIADSDGGLHATRNAWLASLADQLRRKGAAVELFSASGWWYRDLWSIREAGVKAEPAARICSWCDVVIEEGTRPATHGICVACQAQAHEELEKRAGLR